MNPDRIVIAGGSGFIGSALTRAFLAAGHSVTILTRSPRPRMDGAVEVQWDGASSGEWIRTIDGAKAVINLSGKNINCPHTPGNLREIQCSRVVPVNALSLAAAQSRNPPPVWVQASAVGFYGDTGERICDEGAPAGTDALANVCRQWEAAFDSATLPGTRKVTLRIGFVLGNEGGALPVLRRLTKWFIGGRAGNGRQYISWIHLADLTAMFTTAVQNEKLAGIFNAVGTEAVTNERFMRDLRHVMHRPWSPPAPAFAVQLGARLMGSEGSLALINQRCVPKSMLENGYRFQFTDLPSALNNLCQ